jgi:transcriptional regulator with XRE-family HTH domain
VGYRGKTYEQARARDLRSEGWTYTEIMEALGVSKSSVSLWCRDVRVDEEALAARRRNRYLIGNQGARQRGPNRLQRVKQAEIDRLNVEGAERIGTLADRDLLIAGAALYAGEGSKRDGAVRFTNSDPRMIALFLRWFRLCFSVDESRLRLRLYLHEGLDLVEANEFWADLTAIPTTQFIRPYRARPDASIRVTKHPMGCPTVIYSCAPTHRAVMGLVHALLACDVALPG